MERVGAKVAYTGLNLVAAFDNFIMNHSVATCRVLYLSLLVMKPFHVHFMFQVQFHPASWHVNDAILTLFHDCMDG